MEKRSRIVSQNGALCYNWRAMSRAFNFSPGPAALPDAVMTRAREAFLNYRGTGASAMEISHRGAAFMEIYHRAEALTRELLAVPEGYDVLFLPGGAAGMTAAIPLNLAPDGGAAAYAVTGYWSRLAAEEGGKFCAAAVAADGAGENYRRIPSADEWREVAGAAYLHYADNETIHGLEFPAPPDYCAPLVADMTSNILSRPIRVSDYGLIYASAQKNLGPAGVTLVVVRRDLVRANGRVPKVWDFAAQARRESMVNTPPTFQIYMLGLVLEWTKEQGGATEMARRALRRAEAIYAVLDASDFYRTPVAEAAHRSRMNIPFFLPDEDLTADFLREAEGLGLIGLKGHSATGGCRASIYNAMPEAGALALAEHLRDFEKRRG